MSTIKSVTDRVLRIILVVLITLSQCLIDSAYALQVPLRSVSPSFQQAYDIKCTLEWYKKIVDRALSDETIKTLIKDSVNWEKFVNAKAFDFDKDIEGLLNTRPIYRNDPGDYRIYIGDTLLRIFNPKDVSNKVEGYKPIYYWKDVNKKVNDSLHIQVLYSDELIKQLSSTMTLLPAPEKQNETSEKPGNKGRRRITRPGRQDRNRRNRTLQMETLEERQLMSTSPAGADAGTLTDETAVYGSSSYGDSGTAESVYLTSGAAKAATAAVTEQVSAAAADAFFGILEEETLINPDFESGLAGWEVISQTEKASVSVSQNGFEGSNSLKVVLDQKGYAEIAQTLDAGTIEPGKYYEISGKFYAKTGFSVRLYLYDADWKDANGNVTGKCFDNTFVEGSGEWRPLTTRVDSVPSVDESQESTASHNYKLVIRCGDADNCYGTDELTAFFDDIKLNEVSRTIFPETDLTQFQLSGGGVQYCLDFGPDAGLYQNRDIRFNENALGGYFEQDGKAFSKIRSGKAFYIELEQFANIRGKMMIEIGYLDEGYDPCLLNINGYNNCDNFADVRYQDAVMFGGKGDGIYRVMQYAIDLSDQAIFDRFNFMFEGSGVPLDYFSIRNITDDEYEAFYKKVSELNGYYEVAIKDEPDAAVDYSMYGDPDMVVFSRPVTEPVYTTTKPGAAEITDAINVTGSMGGEVFASLSIYSENGADDIEISVKDYSAEERNNKGGLIDIYVVSDKYEALHGYGGPYSSVPDTLVPTGFLKDGKVLVSVNAGETRTIYFKMRSPLAVHGAGEVMEETIQLSKGGQISKEVKIVLDTFEYQLEPLGYRLCVSKDPQKAVSYDSVGAACQVFEESDFEVFLYADDIKMVLQDNKPTYDENGNTLFDLWAITGKLAVYKSYNISERFVVEISSGVMKHIYKYTVGSIYNPNDPQLFKNLMSDAFQKAYGDLVKKIAEVLSGKDVLFFIIDEAAEIEESRVKGYAEGVAVQSAGFKTTSTLILGRDKPLRPKVYEVPEELGSKIPSLGSVVDVKIVPIGAMGEAYKNRENGVNGYEAFAFYTTGVSQHSDPRELAFTLMYGALTEADLVYLYAFNVPDNIALGEDYNLVYDNSFVIFEDPVAVSVRDGYGVSDSTFRSDVSNQLIMRMNLVGAQEGVFISRLVETLKKRIGQYPETQASILAGEYLESIRSSISPNFYEQYIEQAGPSGYAAGMIKDLPGGQDDPGVLDAIKRGLIDHLRSLAEEAYDVLLQTVVKDYIRTSLNAGSDSSQSTVTEDEVAIVFEEFCGSLTDSDKVEIRQCAMSDNPGAERFSIDLLEGINTACYEYAQKIKKQRAQVLSDKVKVRAEKGFDAKMGQSAMLFGLDERNNALKYVGDEFYDDIVDLAFSGDYTADGVLMQKAYNYGWGKAREIVQARRADKVAMYEKFERITLKMINDEILAKTLAVDSESAAKLAKNIRERTGNRYIQYFYVTKGAPRDISAREEFDSGIEEFMKPKLQEQVTIKLSGVNGWTKIIKQRITDGFDNKMDRPQNSKIKLEKGERENAIDLILTGMKGQINKAVQMNDFETLGKMEGDGYNAAYAAARTIIINRINAYANALETYKESAKNDVIEQAKNLGITLTADKINEIAVSAVEDSRGKIKTAFLYEYPTSNRIKNINNRINAYIAAALEPNRVALVPETVKASALSSGGIAFVDEIKTKISDMGYTPKTIAVFNTIYDQTVIDEKDGAIVVFNNRDHKKYFMVPAVITVYTDHSGLDNVESALGVLEQDGITIGENISLSQVAVLSGILFGYSSRPGADTVMGGEVDQLPGILKTFSEPVNIKVPIEYIEGMEKDYGLGAKTREYLLGLAGLEMVCIELYSIKNMRLSKAELKDSYEALGLMGIYNTENPEGGVSKTNTIWLYGVDKSKNNKEINEDIKDSGMQNAIVVPIGLRNDPRGLMRGIHFGERLIAAARARSEAARDRILDEARVFYSNSIASTMVLSMEQLISLISQDVSFGKLINALKCIILSLPVIDKVDVQKMGDDYELSLEIHMAA